MEILIDIRTDDFDLTEEDEKELERAVVCSLKTAGYGTDYEVSFSIVDRDEIRSLNKEYRGKDAVTDVLSFPLYESGAIPAFGLLGDVIICLDRAREQAEDFGHSEKREIVYLTVHSILHLLGYDHMDDEERKEMRSLEKEVMKELGIFKNEG